MHVEVEHKAQTTSSVNSVKCSLSPELLNYQQPPGVTKEISCPRCNKSFQQFNGRNFKAFEFCLGCFRNERNRNKRRSQSPSVLSIALKEKTSVTQNLSMSGILTLKCQKELTTQGNLNTLGCRRPQKVREHPKVHFRLRPIGNNRMVSVVGVADTGAQTNIWSLSEYLKAGYSQQQLQSVSLQIFAANREPLVIKGAFTAEFEGDAPNGEQISCRAVVYVTESVKGFFVSLDTLICLKVVDTEFPTIGSCPILSPCTVGAMTSNAMSCEDKSCDCPRRSKVPPRPKALPFPAIPENNGRMKQWLLDYFGSSTFNICPHRPLQEMDGPPIEIHMDESAEPYVCKTPALISLHWQERVENDIKRDEALGILERVPYGEPVTWCHRMVVTRKHDGTPRRTVDLSPLNKFCKREIHGTDSPFHLARRIPRNTWKTVTDAWNGYHSVPLRVSDRHLTTFITPFGRWRYTRAPQGFVSSGDGYNRRFMAILEGFARMERCVDDTIHYDKNLEDHWWRTVDFLIRVGQSGIVLNPTKLQFAEREVQFAGFKISQDRIEPLPKYLDAIRMFPTPKNSTDIKSWFGLVNQVSTYAQLRDMMTPFRPFLSPKVKFGWSDELDKAFNLSKDSIIKLIRHGVEIFDITRLTCLRPDWSKKGIGYFLVQKHCECESKLPDCCSDGWRITLAGSRFLSDTESRYAAVEGEALAIAWSLEQTRYFTQGCDKLIVVTDHKPLVKLFGDRTLDEITNTRLFRLKQRTLQWYFEVAYLPGKTNLAADAASRHPVSGPSICQMSQGDLTEHLMAAAINQEVTSMTSISWQTMVTETERDPALVELTKAIIEGFCGTYELLAPFLRYKDSLYIQDGVILYNDRVVVPNSLRPSVLESLHAAHQGTAAMQMRAQAIVFWPGITRDIAETRNKCYECNRNAPSQPSHPSEPTNPPSAPFEEIFADFFHFGGHQYLVAGDRLSGFTEVFATPTGTSQSGAGGLIKCLRQWFATFGVPKELASDGGPEFSADSTSSFLKTWGVEHRRSSAYYPQSNGRAEVAVKMVKRLLRSNVGPLGSLNTDKFLKAILQLRNTPDPDCGVSPAEIVFGRRLRDNLQFTEYTNRDYYAKRWREAWSAKEEALRTRFVRNSENMNCKARQLPPLQPGTKCFIQNQSGNFPKKWHHTGTIIESLPYDKYAVRVDGSNRLTYRNRKFLKAYTSVRLTVDSGSQPRPASLERWRNDVTPETDVRPRMTYPFGESTSVRPQVVNPSNENLRVRDSGTIPGSGVLPNEGTFDPETLILPNQEASRNVPRKKPVPLALRRLRDFNSPGLNETVNLDSQH